MIIEKRYDEAIRLFGQLYAPDKLDNYSFLAGLNLASISESQNDPKGACEIYEEV